MSNDPVKKHNEFLNDVMNNKLLQGKTGTMYIPELLSRISDFTKRGDKIKVLHMNKTPALQIIFRLAFDDDIEFVFTRRDLDALEYNPMDIPDFDLAPTNLFKEAPKFVNFTNRKKGVKMSKEKSLKVIGEIFSALHPLDVEVVKQMVDGNFKYKTVTKKLVLEAFPNLIPSKPVLPFDEDEKLNTEKTETDQENVKSDEGDTNGS